MTLNEIDSMVAKSRDDLGRLRPRNGFVLALTKAEVQEIRRDASLAAWLEIQKVGFALGTEPAKYPEYIVVGVYHNVLLLEELERCDKCGEVKTGASDQAILDAEQRFLPRAKLLER